ncbi:HEPN domain-containing protein [Ciceribacter ferrooxidans]|uniref:RiboL-PSP-HEPN domain-containing protein n=1 Tax=Ciceribacter ferrooxidans TaxID=2509717 RepID=A0A4Q2TWW2_9HYPH|nr:HEPN domain-containing protein [Ciceribacter ferrooxidans]RYC23673.1 hypothetical protein EUU22_02880 [Ciceribacter ferrooxidans]
MYLDVLQTADQYMQLIAESATAKPDQEERNKYVGFVAVTAVTFFEEAVKEIIKEFANKKHPILGNYVAVQYHKLNGRITIKDIKTEHIPKFGDKYKKRFESILSKVEEAKLRAGLGSVMSSYGNIVTWRHSFVHGGSVPSNATYEESVKCYQLGKDVLHCLNDSLRR